MRKCIFVHLSNKFHVWVLCTEDALSFFSLTSGQEYDRGCQCYLVRAGGEQSRGLQSQHCEMS